MLRVFSRLFSQRGNGNAALTYANDVQMDGAGAQLQRIYGIYALSRALKVPYVHSPLKEVGYQGLAALESNSASQDIQDRYNRIFSIPSDIEVPENTNVEFLDNTSIENIERIIKKKQD